MAAATVLARHPALRAVWSKTLRDQRRALVWWLVGVAAVVLMYSSFYPSVRDNAAQFDDYLKNLPRAVRDMFGGEFTSPAGYLQSEVFTFMGPILLLVYAIGAGARAIAGEEDAGTLDLLLSTPVRRRRVVFDKFLAMAIGTTLLGAAAWLTALVFGPAFGVDIALAHLTAAFLNLLLLALAFGSIALAIGSAGGGKGLAIGGASGLALLTFLLKTFSVSVSALEPYRVLSPFYYYIGHDPLRVGFHVLDPIVLAAIAIVALVVALVTFERRDLAT